MNRALFVGRIAVAVVWLYQGLWCKLIGGEPHHRAIVEQALGTGWGTLVVMGLGTVETLMALWVLSGRWPRSAAWVQTMLLVAMNGAGLLLASEHIADALGMVVMNGAFLALVWIVALERR